MDAGHYIGPYILVRPKLDHRKCSLEPKSNHVKVSYGALHQLPHHFYDPFDESEKFSISRNFQIDIFNFVYLPENVGYLFPKDSGSYEFSCNFKAIDEYDFSECQKFIDFLNQHGFEYELKKGFIKL